MTISEGIRSQCIVENSYRMTKNCFIKKVHRFPSNEIPNYVRTVRCQNPLLLLKIIL